MIGLPRFMSLVTVLHAQINKFHGLQRKARLESLLPVLRFIKEIDIYFPEGNKVPATAVKLYQIV